MEKVPTLHADGCENCCLKKNGEWGSTFCLSLAAIKYLKESKRTCDLEWVQYISRSFCVKYFSLFGFDKGWFDQPTHRNRP